MANQLLTACRSVNCYFEGYVGISKLTKQLGNTPPVVLPPFDDTTLIRNYYDAVNTALDNKVLIRGIVRLGGFILKLCCK